MSETSERMSRVDTAWLRMDSAHNLMMIVGVWLLQPRLDPAALRRRLQSKLLGYARFRQKVVQEAVLSYWVEDDDFDIERHVLREKLARRRGQSEREALQARASELATTPLDPAHPLWQMHVFEHCEDGSAVIVRIHHRTKPLQDALANVFLHKTTAVMTNVQGLAQPVRICGSTVRQSIFWVPSSGDVGVGVSIVSYVGGVQFSLITDGRRCPDPQRIIDRFAPEFESLLLLTLMLPWAGVASQDGTAWA